MAVGNALGRDAKGVGQKFNTGLTRRRIGPPEDRVEVTRHIKAEHIVALYAKDHDGLRAGLYAPDQFHEMFGAAFGHAVGKFRQTGNAAIVDVLDLDPRLCLLRVSFNSQSMRELCP